MKVSRFLSMVCVFISGLFFGNTIGNIEKSKENAVRIAYETSCLFHYKEDNQALKNRFCVYYSYLYTRKFMLKNYNFTEELQDSIFNLKISLKSLSELYTSTKNKEILEIIISVEKNINTLKSIMESKK